MKSRTLTAQRRAQPKRFGFERRVFLMAMLAGLPGALVALIMLWIGDYSANRLLPTSSEQYA